MFVDHPDEAEFASYIYFLVFDAHPEIHINAGDTLLIDHSPVGYWNDRDYHNEVVLVRTHYGPLIGRFNHGPNVDVIRMLDGTGNVVIRTPEMVILGVARLMSRPISEAPNGDNYFD
jgi:hypothetical protein